MAWLGKKKVRVDSVSGLLIETLLVAPFAIVYFIYLIYTNQNAFDFSSNTSSFLLICAGLATIIPLVWFNSAAIRISMMKLGFLQYIAPNIAFLLAVFLYDEPLGFDKLVTFMMIWAALILFSIKKICYTMKQFCNF